MSLRGGAAEPGGRRGGGGGGDARSDGGGEVHAHAGGLAHPQGGGPIQTAALHSIDPDRLKAPPGLVTQPLNLHKVFAWFPKFAFKRICVPLRRGAIRGEQRDARRALRRLRGCRGCVPAAPPHQRVLHGPPRARPASAAIIARLAGENTLAGKTQSLPVASLLHRRRASQFRRHGQGRRQFPTRARHRGRPLLVVGFRRVAGWGGAN